MNKLFKERMTADINDEFVVFLIGMRINNALESSPMVTSNTCNAKNA